MSHVAVIDYGMGNLRSVSKALKAVSDRNISIEVTADPDRILAASHVVFPGQGAIGPCRTALNNLGLTKVIRRAADEKPFLGICIGMQLLLSYSEENNGVAGLDIISGGSHQFNNKQKPHLKIPHMGWNQVHQTAHHPLWQNIEQDSYFYFVHSYFVSTSDNSVVTATTTYTNIFTSALCKDNVFAVQFHPEKSQHSGLKLLGNFLRWQGGA